MSATIIKEVGVVIRAAGIAKGKKKLCDWKEKVRKVTGKKVLVKYSGV